ncbi:hypothetical protein EXE48_11820 [Halorubrum sp. ASP1]|uniref:hypothetical protein n=1 Tax=Halorubrum sp. ASP1 TaxID=2518114 RepID=UPI0010F8D71F|nr:hypothetical protein [Halorubrum sp. ASP1]TKX60653.1 hypothetical protein EXE48_11820 [Halorubrum sp. ASP1]
MSLGDVSFEKHAAELPPQHRVTTQLESPSDFYDCSPGDTIWLDGDEYVILEFGTSLLAPTPVTVANPNGETKVFRVGRVDSDSVGFCSQDKLDTLNDGETPKRSDLACDFDRAYLLETGRHDRIHNWTPTACDRACPDCGKDNGEPIQIEKQAGHSVELRKCSDCNGAYRYTTPLTSSESATVLTYTKDGEMDTVDISGTFRVVEQDSFKFPTDTNNGRDDGVRTAKEVAEFVNKKILSPPFHSLLTDDPDLDAIREQLHDSLDPDVDPNVLSPYTDDLPPKPDVYSTFNSESGVIPDSQGTARFIHAVVSHITQFTPGEVLQLLGEEDVFGTVGHHPDGKRVSRMTTYDIPDVNRRSPLILWRDGKYDIKMRIGFFKLTREQPDYKFPISRSGSMDHFSLLQEHE